MFGEITLLMVLQGAALVAAGAAAGYFLALNNFDKQRDKLKDELERARAELKEQREKVDNHFLKTAQLFNRLTDDYREIYEHLATGAQSLCSPEISTPQLDQPETRVLPAIEGSTAVSEASSDSGKAAPEASKPDIEAETKDIKADEAKGVEPVEAKDSKKTATEAAAETPPPEEATELKAEAETPPDKAGEKPSGTDATPAPTTASDEKSAAEATAAPAAGEEKKEEKEKGKEEKKEDKSAAEASPTAEADEEKPTPSVATTAKAAADIDRHKSPPSIH